MVFVFLGWRGGRISSRWRGKTSRVVFSVFWPCPSWVLKKDNRCRCIISMVLFLLASLLCFFLHKPPGMVHTHTHTAVCVMPFLPLGLWCMQGPVFTKSLDLLAILEQVIGYKCFSPFPFSCQFLSYLPGLSVNSLWRAKHRRATALTRAWQW